MYIYTDIQCIDFMKQVQGMLLSKLRASFITFPERVS